MDTQQPSSGQFHEKILEINNKLKDARDFDSAIKITAEELKIALEVNRIQIILHRTEQKS